MKIKFILALLAVLSFGLLCGAILTPRGIASNDHTRAQNADAPPASLAAQDPAPQEPAAIDGAPAAVPITIGIPGVPSGNCCIWQLEKRMDGKRMADYSGPYKCPVNLTVPFTQIIPTMQGKMSIDLVLASGGQACDPLAQLIPNASHLRATGRVIRRNDDFAHFNGDFVIVSPSGATLFRGHIETTDRIGSHHQFINCEQCNPISHFEGWIVGQGLGSLASYTVRAQITSRGTVPNPQVPSMAAVGSLSGVYIRCP